MRQEIYKKLETHYSGSTLAQLESIEWYDLIKVPTLTKEEIKFMGPYHRGFVLRLIRAEKARLEVLAKTAMKTKLATAGTDLTSGEMDKMLELIFDERRKNEITP